MWDLFHSFDENSKAGMSQEDDDGSIKQSDEDEQWKRHRQPLRRTCTYCASNDVALRDGTLSCQECQTVFGRSIDCVAEWRFHGGEDAHAHATDTRRCGPPVRSLLPALDTGVTCAPGASGGGDSGAACHSGIGRALQRLQMWRSLTHRERNLFHIFDTMAVSSANHGISPCILEAAKHLYKRVADQKLSRGENRRALVASSVYVACKQNCVPRSLREVADMFDVRTAAMTKACKQFQEIMRSSLVSSRPEDFVPRFCSRLGLSADTQALCRAVVERASALGVCADCTPPSLVAGAIALCCDAVGAPVCRRRVADACMLSDVTVAKCHKRLLKEREALMALTPPGKKIENESPDT